MLLYSPNRRTCIRWCWCKNITTLVYSNYDQSVYFLFSFFLFLFFLSFFFFFFFFFFQTLLQPSLANQMRWSKTTLPLIENRKRLSQNKNKHWRESLISRLKKKKKTFLAQIPPNTATLKRQSHSSLRENNFGTTIPTNTKGRLNWKGNSVLSFYKSSKNKLQNVWKVKNSQKIKRHNKLLKNVQITPQYHTYPHFVHIAF